MTKLPTFILDARNYASELVTETFHLDTVRLPLDTRRSSTILHFLPLIIFYKN